MTSELTDFATRLREFIRSSEGRVPRGLVSVSDFKSGDSQSSSLRKKEFEELALELFALQFKHNVPYRRICEARGASPDTVEHWTQIPAVPTAAFKELELTCLPPNQRTKVFYSSGTTEQRPSRHFHSAESLAVYEASLWPGFVRHVVPDFKSQIPNFKLVILTPPPAQAAHSSLVHMFDVIRRKLGTDKSAFVGRVGEDGAWTLDFDAALDALSLRTSSLAPQPLLLLGTAFSFVHLLDFLRERDLSFRLPPGSRVMETGGYKGRSRSLLKADLHALITEWLGIPPSHIVCEYGMSELSSQAYDLAVYFLRLTPEASRLFHFPSWARVQIVSPETGREVAEGETGLIRIFDLANVFSVMAIQTEDLGVCHGDGFELIGRAEFSEPRGCSLMSVETLNH